jgi:LPS-assembly lipoprotein
MIRSGTLACRILMLLGLGGLLPSCGFHPLYAKADGQPTAVQTHLAEIDVTYMPERIGQLLRGDLQARLERDDSGRAKRFDLGVAFGLGSDLIGVNPDSSISRVRLTGTARWTLTAQDPQRSTLATGVARDVDGYNILDEQYFYADLQNEAVQRRIADALAEQMTLQLATYFNKHPNL